MKKVDLLIIIPPFHMRNGGGSFSPLGTGYIASSVAAAGYSFSVLNCSEYINSFFSCELQSFASTLKHELEKYSPDVIGIGPCITTQLRALKIIADVCQESFPYTPIFAGGPLVSIQGQEWIFFEYLRIHYLIKGDGEDAVVDVIRTIKKYGDIRKSKCISYKGHLIVNHIDILDSIKFPTRQFDPFERFSVRRAPKKPVHRQAAMITSRGCPYSCNYCVSGNMKANGIRFRRRSINNILEEMISLRDCHHVDDIVFYDDCFFSNITTVNHDIEVFCNALKTNQIDMTWQVEMRPDIFCRISESSFRLLDEMGCRQISLGIEKISRAGLSFLGKAGAWSNLGEFILKVKLTTSISVSATFILGGGSENEEDVKMLIEESTKLNLDFAHYNPLFIYPGTPLYSSMFNNPQAWATYILHDNLPWGEIVYENDFLKRDQLIALVEYAYLRFYENTPYADQQMIKDRFNLRHGGSHEDI